MNLELAKTAERLVVQEIEGGLVLSPSAIYMFLIEKRLSFSFF